MPLLDDVATYLESQGVGTVKMASNNPASWAIYKGGNTPANVDAIITLTEYGGEPSVDTFGTNVAVAVVDLRGALGIERETRRGLSGVRVGPDFRERALVQTT